MRVFTVIAMAAKRGERLVAAMEAMTLQNQQMMVLMTSQSAAASERSAAQSVNSMASLARSTDTKGMLKIDAYYDEKENSSS